MPACRPDPTPPDILEAMRAQGSFVDITPGDAAKLLAAARAMAEERLRRTVLVGQVMTPSPVTLDASLGVREAARVLARAGISGAPVLDGGRLAGVVSLKDFLGLLGLPREAGLAVLVSALMDGASCTAEGCGEATVGRVMTSPAVTASPDTPAFEAASLMSARGINRLPVISSSGELAGIVSRSDLVRAFGELLEGAK